MREIVCVAHYIQVICNTNVVGRQAGKHDLLKNLPRVLPHEQDTT